MAPPVAPMVPPLAGSVVRQMPASRLLTVDWVALLCVGVCHWQRIVGIECPAMLNTSLVKTAFKSWEGHTKRSLPQQARFLGVRPVTVISVVLNALEVTAY